MRSTWPPSRMCGRWLRTVWSSAQERKLQLAPSLLVSHLPVSQSFPTRLLHFDKIRSQLPYLCVFQHEDIAEYGGQHASVFSRRAHAPLAGDHVVLFLLPRNDDGG